MDNQGHQASRLITLYKDRQHSRNPSRGNKKIKSKEELEKHWHYVAKYQKGWKESRTEKGVYANPLTLGARGE